MTQSLPCLLCPDFRLFWKLLEEFEIITVEGCYMIGQILRYMRKQSGFNQCEIGKKTGIARNTISQYETGTIQPVFETIEKIAETCNYEILFQNKKTKQYITSKSIRRKDI